MVAYRERHQLMDALRSDMPGISVTLSAPLEIDEPASVYETVLRLWVTRSPKRIRGQLESFLGHEARSDLLVIDGATYWDRDGHDVTTNSGDPSITHGGGKIADLLYPEEIPIRFNLDVLGTELVAGRSCTVVSAIAQVPVSSAFAPFQMIAGSTDFRLSIDDERGVLLRVIKLVNGADVEINEFSAIEFDRILAPELFDSSDFGGARELTIADLLLELDADR